MTRTTKNAVIVNSLAGTERKYVQAQGRFQNGNLHIQIQGPAWNRHYGFACNIPVWGLDLVSAIMAASHDAQSLVGTNTQYSQFQLAVREPGKVHMQIACTKRINRPYGFAADLVNQDLEEYITSILPVEKFKTKYILTMQSEEFGVEEFWYDTDEERHEGLRRILEQIKQLDDGITRKFSFSEEEKR